MEAGLVNKDDQCVADNRRLDKIVHKFLPAILSAAFWRRTSAIIAELKNPPHTESLTNSVKSWLNWQDSIKSEGDIICK